MKQSGAPVEWYAIEPAIGRANGVAIVKTPAHPNAAALFVDFVLSPEGQKILEHGGYVPANLKLANRAQKLPLKFVDPAVILDESDKWKKLWDEIVLEGGDEVSDKLDAARTCLLLFDFLAGTSTARRQSRKRFAPVIANAAQLLDAARRTRSMVAYAHADHRADRAHQRAHASRYRQPAASRSAPDDLAGHMPIITGGTREADIVPAAGAAGGRLRGAEASLERVPRHLPRPRAAHAQRRTRSSSAADPPTWASPRRRSPRATSTTTWSSSRTPAPLPKRTTTTSSCAASFRAWRACGPPSRSSPCGPHEQGVRHLASTMTSNPMRKVV